MRVFFKSLNTSLIVLALFTLLFGILYPYVTWGIGQLFFHKHANGMLLYHKNGKVIGSEWIAQNFTTDKYFHPRPSYAGDKGYDATSSAGSNLGPTSQKFIDALTQRVADYRQANNITGQVLIPSDAVTASGSGLDPHISVENAKLQAGRVATARGLSQDRVNQLIEDFTDGRTLGIFGEPRINVLRINLELDKLKQ